MSSINPENKCADLVNSEDVKYPSIEEMFDMQLQLQRFLHEKKPQCLDFDHATFMDKMKEIKNQWTYLTTEYVELIERVPFKTWKSYSPEQKVGFLSEEDKLETQFEYIDMFHFFMNIGLLIGIDGKTFAKLYYLKNKENFDRQNRGY
jgi:hypothetical protein